MVTRWIKALGAMDREAQSYAIRETTSRSAHLKPAPHAALAREIVSLAGGIDALVLRAKALLKGGDLRLASHLIDWAVAAEPQNIVAQDVRSEIYTERTQQSSALMSKGVFGAVTRESKKN